MSWEGFTTQLGEVKDAYLDPLFDKPDSAAEILQKIKDRELGIDWWEEETRKLKALKDLIPEKKQQQVASILSQAGDSFNKAWKGAETVENWTDPGDVVAAGAAHTINLANEGIGLFTDGLSAVAHHGLRLHKPVAGLTGTAASMYLTPRLLAGTGRVINRQIAISKLPASEKVVNVKSMLGNQLPPKGRTSSSVLGKNSMFRTGSKAESRAIQLRQEIQAVDDAIAGRINTDKPYALLSVRPTADKGAIGDLLTQSNQPVSEILPPEWMRKAGGVGLYNPDQAGAVQKLITQKIHTAVEAGPKFVKEMFEEIWPHVDADKLTTRDMKKKLTKALGSATKAKGPVDTSNLDRGLAEILVGDKRFLHDIGIIEDVVNNPNVLEPKNISKWLGGIDSRVSSTTKGVAKHHTSLTSSKPVLDNATPQWGERFLNLMREKITPGAEGIVKQDALGHKPFSSPRIKNKSGKLVNDNTKWVVKGVLGDVLKEFADFPKSATGDILVNKEISNIGDWSKGLEGQLQKVIRSINDKAAHANWSHGTTGWTLDSRLAQYSPEDAFSVAEYIFDLERTVSAQGIRVTQTLNKWKKTISKGDFGNPPNLEKAVADLQRKIDNIRIDKSRIKTMEEAYQIRLDILTKEGPEALREFNTKAYLGARPRPAPDPVKSMNK